ncbi:hypothetical protein [Aliiruegeria sabulilitoris]|uniref:hypothetical protein n=1 Tax=Aliiruegeria sabulilitoris TaxID=1510458 RepID=UPI0012E3F186|nr:hypothetical protein [Aliiruegeria sabulilitoris]
MKAFPMLFQFRRLTEIRHRCRPRGVPRDLSPQQMRDIGLEPWPERPLIFPRALW